MEEGGQTRIPRLNLTVDTTAYAALLFNNCLDNGEPDERTLHEGVAPTVGTKYASTRPRQIEPSLPSHTHREHRRLSLLDPHGRT